MQTSQPHSVADTQPWRRLVIMALLLGGSYLVMAAISQFFAYGTRPSERPVLLFVLLMSVAFVIHLISLQLAVSLKPRTGLGKWIILVGLGYRFIVLPSHPIQEIDIYRYMWDGRSVANGCNPYLYSPRDVLAASEQTTEEGLRDLVFVRNQSEETRAILSRVHFEHLTTIYPPVSQAVFAAAAFVAPETSAISIQRTITKAFIVVFDVLTMLSLLRLLRFFGKSEGWLICYAWSPLVLKEFANSGHLDAIAVGLTACAAVHWLEALRTKSTLRLMVAAAVLGLGVGAKLYPVVIVPVIAVSVAKYFGVRRLFESATLFSVVSTATLWPMLSAKPIVVPAQLISATEAIAEPAPQSPPLPDDYTEVVQNDDHIEINLPPRPGDVRPPLVQRNVKATEAGLAAFMSTWRMNDLVFQLVNENLTSNSTAWFSIVPDAAKRRIIEPLSKNLQQSNAQTSFLITRCLTASLHLLIVLWLAAKAWHAPQNALPNLAFLSIAWFWLLLPTLNPWYWIWAMPWLPFARLRSWLLLSGCVSFYYVRFWLQYHFATECVPGTPYLGADFFGYVVVWVEYVPFLLIMVTEFLCRRRK